jgi:hypothetical protein
MSREKKKHPFKRCESGYHKYAVTELATWVNGVIEKPFEIDGKMIFIPDVTCYKNGILDSIYEIVNRYPITGYKLGMIEYWCYRNSTELTVFEVSADFVLRQTDKPERIETMECYLINPFGDENRTDEFVSPNYESAIHCDVI